MDHDDGSNNFSYAGDKPVERVTRLSGYLLEAAQEHPDYRTDDKIAVLITNGVTKSDWDRVEFGCGFWNFEDPREAIFLILQHVINLGESYGLEIGIMEARVQQMPMQQRPSVDQLVRLALAKIVQDIERKEREGNAAGE